MEKKKVFGIGFSKTGTTSLENALTILGYNVCKGHWATNYTFYLLSLYIHRDYKELIRMTQYWDAFCDGPWGGTTLYKDLYKNYPDAKYVFTQRAAEDWYKSFEKLIKMFDQNQETALDTYHKKGMWGSAYFFEHIFEIKTLANNKDKIIEKYKEHNQSILDFFSDKPDKFLLFDIRVDNPWEALCTFLEKDIPNISYPHANKSSRVAYINNIQDAGLQEAKLQRVRKRFIENSVKKLNQNK